MPNVFYHELCFQLPGKSIQETNPSIIVEEASLTDLGDVSHSIYKGHPPGSNETWFCKEIKKDEELWLAQSELLAQELFRLIIPYQPETRIARDSYNRYYILSKGIAEYRPLPTEQKEQFGNGHYTNLGGILAAAMFLQETDLHAANIGLDAANRVVKIDGGHCFKEFQTLPPDIHAEYLLTNRSIQNLPEPCDFWVNHWLDLVDATIINPDSNTLDATALSQAKAFRADINQALFRMCLIPDCLIEAMAKQCVSERPQQFIDLLKNRREKLRMAALNNTSFREYLASTPAFDAWEKTRYEFENFTVNGRRLEIQGSMREEFVLRSNQLFIPVLKDNCELMYSLLPRKRDNHASNPSRQYDPHLFRNKDANFLDLWAEHNRLERLTAHVQLPKTVIEKQKLMKEQMTSHNSSLQATLDALPYWALKQKYVGYLQTEIYATRDSILHKEGLHPELIRHLSEKHGAFFDLLNPPISEEGNTPKAKELEPVLQLLTSIHSAQKALQKLQETDNDKPIYQKLSNALGEVTSICVKGLSAEEQATEQSKIQKLLDVVDASKKQLHEQCKALLTKCAEQSSRLQSVSYKTELYQLSQRMTRSESSFDISAYIKIRSALTVWSQKATETISREYKRTYGGDLAAQGIDSTMEDTSTTPHRP